MGDEPLPVAKQAPRQAEELHGDDRDRQRRLLRAAETRGRSATPRWRSARSPHRPRRRRAGWRAPAVRRPDAPNAASGRSGACAPSDVVAGARTPGSTGRGSSPSGSHRRSLQLDHPVGQRHQRRPVRDQHHPAAAHRAAAAPPVPRPRWPRRGWPSARRATAGRVTDERPRERDALALADRQPGAAIAEHRVEPLGPRADALPPALPLRTACSICTGVASRRRGGCCPRSKPRTGAGAAASMRRARATRRGPAQRTPRRRRLRCPRRARSTPAARRAASTCHTRSDP